MIRAERCCDRVTDRASMLGAFSGKKEVVVVMDDDEEEEEEEMWGWRETKWRGRSGARPNSRGFFSSLARSVSSAYAKVDLTSCGNLGGFSSSLGSDGGRRGCLGTPILGKIGFASAEVTCALFSR